MHPHVILDLLRQVIGPGLTPLIDTNGELLREDLVFFLRDLGVPGAFCGYRDGWFEVWPEERDDVDCYLYPLTVEQYSQFVKWETTAGEVGSLWVVEPFVGVSRGDLWIGVELVYGPGQFGPVCVRDMEKLAPRLHKELAKRPDAADWLLDLDFESDVNFESDLSLRLVRRWNTDAAKIAEEIDRLLEEAKGAL